MKVATFNVNSLRARLDAIFEWLKGEAPDVICLQETKLPDADFPIREFGKLGYNCIFRGEKGRNGVAILSVNAIKDVRIGFDERESDGSRLIAAKINNIRIVNTYVPQGVSPLSDEFRQKLDWLQRLYDYFRDNFTPDTPILWAGDFNIAPESIDVYDPKYLEGHVGFHPDERAVLMRFREWGLIDVFRMLNRESGHYSYFDYQITNAVKKNKGWRIDHIFATRPLADKCVRSWIDMAPRLKVKPSDHTPVVAEFKD